ncbi:MAG TPA: hypothetical protein VF522_07795 [Ramlibacter sp.]|uniref:hypothetical protein n=1 Tax=Ramlibacter sp. TaxID=1917967 RepID=UPI002ED679A1
MMRKFVTTGLGLAALALAGSAHAGRCQDPWLTKAFEEVHGRAPYDSGTIGECDPRRYGNGHWGNHADLLAKVRAEAAKPPATREQVVRPNDQFAAQARYDQKRYPEAQRALNQCANFRNIDPTRKSAPSYEVVPHPAVKHAAEVDMPAHGGNGGGLCSYVRKPDVQQWYRQNFRL